MSQSLPEHPDLDQLRRQAKELRDAAQRGDPAAADRFARHHPSASRDQVPLAAQLVEIGALGKRLGHGVSLRRLRSAAQAEEEATALAWGCSEVDSVLSADPVAPSRRQSAL